MFAIYPAVDKKMARSHAVVFTTDPEIAKVLCHHFHMDRGLEHEAYLVLDSWPDPELMNELNMCGPDVYFSVRDGKAAHDASMVVYPILRDHHFKYLPQ